MLYALVGVLVTVAAAQGSRSAQAQTQTAPQADRAAQEAACSGDATRFCAEAIPDEQKIAACLRANRAKISQACQAMLK
jgi:hypothetical protein